MRTLTLCLLILCQILATAAQNNGTCLDSSVCGNYSSCVSQQCMCDSGYVSDLSNSTYCLIKLDTSCQQDNCLLCDPSKPLKCFHCRRGTPLDIILGSCVSRCEIGSQIEIVKLQENSTLSRLVCIPDTTPSNPNAPAWLFVVLFLILGMILTGVIVVIVYLIYIRYKVIIPSLSGKQRSFELSTVEANARAGIGPTHKKDSPVEIVRGLVRADAAEPEIAPTLPDKDTDTRSMLTAADITLQSQDSISATNPVFERELTPEKLAEEFNEKLNELREKAPTFLQMLNDMRRRLKELPADHQNVVQYKAVMRDITRLLYLLNKRPENVEIPPDGVKLLSWAERILQRYLMAQEEARRLAREKRQPQGQGAKPRVSMILGEQDETKF